MSKKKRCYGFDVSYEETPHIWSHKHDYPIDDEYVILDSQLPHFILTNPYEGITEEQANRAISILNGKFLRPQTDFIELCLQMA